MKVLYFIGSLLLSVALLSGCSQTEESINIETESVEEDKASQLIKVDGTVRCTETQDIYMEFPAIVNEVYVEEGDVIQKGEALLSFDAKDYLDTITKEEDQVKSLEIQLKQLESQKTVGVSEIVALKEELQLKQNYFSQNTDPKMISLTSELLLAEEQLSILNTEYTSQKEIYEAGGTAEKTLRDINDQIEIKKNLMRSIQEKINDLHDSTQIEISALKANITAKELAVSNSESSLASEIAQVKLQLKMAKDTLSNLKEKLNKVYIKENNIINTIDNMVIDSVSCYKGTRVAGKEVTLMKGISQDSLLVTLEVPAEDVGYLKIGDEVQIDAYIDDVTITGVISRIAMKAMKDNGDFVAVDVTVTEGKEYLRHGVEIEAQLSVNRG